MRVLTSLVAVLALGAALAQPAVAAPVSLGSFTHNYGIGTYDLSLIHISIK